MKGSENTPYSLKPYEIFFCLGFPEKKNINPKLEQTGVTNCESWVLPHLLLYSLRYCVCTNKKEGIVGRMTVLQPCMECLATLCGKGGSGECALLG